MLSESARMSSAAEARFRVQAPNSQPRAIKVIALDAVAEAVVRDVGHAGWTNATFFTAPRPAERAVVADLSGHERDVAQEIAGADLVVLVAGPGGHAHAAAAIGEACSARRVMTTGFIVGARSAPDDELSKTLAQIRPWSLMLVISNHDDYITDMMVALRA